MRSIPAYLLLMLAAACSPSEPDSSPNRSLVGTWGGDDAGFIVTDTSAHAHIGCTKGDVSGAIGLNEDGRFDVVGEYNVDAYPVDRGILHPARFIGVVEGRSLQLIVVLTDTLLTLGPVSLEYERQPEMRMCPICAQ